MASITYKGTLIMFVKRVKNYLRRFSNQNSELIWANIWHETCNGIDWLQDMPSISPGRSAVGYNYLYVMTRILNELEPHRVLDIGLGISSTLISKYFEKKAFHDGCHLICEHDETWICFYSNKHSFSNYSHIAKQELVMKNNGKNDYYAYKDLKKDLAGQTFSVLSIDAPFGYGGGYSSRRDIIEFLPGILEDDFVIVIDDYDRIGEQNTVKEIEGILNAKGISYASGIYLGLSNICVITAECNKFLCTL